MTRYVVGLIEEFPLFEAGIEGLFAGSSEFEFVGCLNKVNLNLIRSSDSKTFLISLAPTQSKRLEEVRAEFPDAHIIQLFGHDDAPALYVALKSGIAGCLSSRCTFAEVLQAVRCIGSGKRYLSPDLTSQLMSFSIQQTAAKNDPFATLTSREEQILELLGSGLSNKEIGWRLTISEKTVKHYLTSILDKLNVQNRVQAALLVAGRQAPLSYA